MLRTLGIGAICLVAGFAARPALAGSGGTITHGDVSFVRAAFGAVPSADLTGVSTGGGDTVDRTGWWYRKSGASAETAFPEPASGHALYSDNISSIDWDGLASGSFSALEHSEVYDAGIQGVPGDGGYVYQAMSIQNESGSQTLNITIYHYVDLDVLPNNFDDDADWVEFPGLIEAYDGPSYASYLAQTFPGAHQVGAHPVIVNLLNDVSVSTLNNTGTPVSGIDFTAAYQWSLSIPPNGEVTVAVEFAVNTSLRCGAPIQGGLFCDAFESHNTNFWSDSAP